MRRAQESSFCSTGYKLAIKGVKVKHAVRFFTAGCILNKFPVLYHEAYRNNYKLIDISGRQMDLNKWGRGKKIELMVAIFLKIQIMNER